MKILSKKLIIDFNYFNLLITYGNESFEQILKRVQQLPENDKIKLKSEIEKSLSNTEKTKKSRTFGLKTWTPEDFEEPLY